MFSDKFYEKEYEKYYASFGHPIIKAIINTSDSSYKIGRIRGIADTILFTTPIGILIGYLITKI